LQSRKERRDKSRTINIFPLRSLRLGERKRMEEDCSRRAAKNAEVRVGQLISSLCVLCALARESLEYIVIKPRSPRSKAKGA